MNNNKIPVLIWLYHKDKWNYILSKLVDCKDLVCFSKRDTCLEAFFKPLSLKVDKIEKIKLAI